MKVVEVRNLKKYYNVGENQVRAIDDISFSIEKGAFVAIIGRSGSGKSTLLHLLGGLDKETSGDIFIGEKRIKNMSDDEITIFRRRSIGFIFQSYNLIPALTVKENIVLPVEIDNEEVDEVFLNEILDVLGLTSKREELPMSLSGGQQQRVAIARAVINKPDIILADEPTGNLDSKTEIEVLGLLKKLIKKYNQTLVMITHNMDIARLADRVITIEDGKIGGENLEGAL
ncbi:MAG: ABC transporter ATP-binding protein [Sarcina sp.]